MRKNKEFTAHLKTPEFHSSRDLRTDKFDLQISNINIENHQINFRPGGRLLSM